VTAKKKKTKSSFLGERPNAELGAEGAGREELGGGRSGLSSEKGVVSSHKKGGGIFREREKGRRLMRKETNS